MTLVETLLDYLQTNWTSTLPSTFDVRFSIRRLEENSAYDQIVMMDNFTAAIVSDLISGNLYRKTHSIEVQVYVKPRKYGTIGETYSNTILSNIITEIDRIFTSGRFLALSDGEVQLGNWDNTTDWEQEPSVFSAKMRLKCIYYKEEI